MSCVCVSVSKSGAGVQGDTGVLNWVSIFISQGELTHTQKPTQSIVGFFKVNLDAKHTCTHTHTHGTRVRTNELTHFPDKEDQELFLQRDRDSRSESDGKKRKGGCSARVSVRPCSGGCLLGRRVSASNRWRDRGRSAPTSEARAAVKASKVLSVCACGSVVMGATLPDVYLRMTGLRHDRHAVTQATTTEEHKLNEDEFKSKKTEKNTLKEKEAQKHCRGGICAAYPAQASNAKSAPGLLHC